MKGLRDLVLGQPRITIYDVPDSPNRAGDGAINGRQVALWRPPVMLNTEGQTMPGVNKELIANYLVSTVGALARTDLGPVTVTWRAQEGRFASTTLTIHTWNQAVDILHPVAVISQKLANAMEHYKAGMINKVRQLHKGHQMFDQANEQINRAMREVEKLRDDCVPHFNDAEFLFVMACMAKGLTLSALIPVSPHEPESAIGAAVAV